MLQQTLNQLLDKQAEQFSGHTKKLLEIRRQQNTIAINQQIVSRGLNIKRINPVERRARVSQGRTAAVKLAAAVLERELTA